MALENELKVFAFFKRIVSLKEVKMPSGERILKKQIAREPLTDEDLARS
jgi:hypothetical protein